MAHAQNMLLKRFKLVIWMSLGLRLPPSPCDSMTTLSLSPPEHATGGRRFNQSGGFKIPTAPMFDLQGLCPTCRPQSTRTERLQPSRCRHNGGLDLLSSCTLLTACTELKSPKNRAKELATETTHRLPAGKEQDQARDNQQSLRNL